MVKSFRRNLLQLLAALMLPGLIAVATAAPKKAPAKKPVASKPKPAPQNSSAPLAPGEIPLAAEAAVLVDSQTGEFLYAKQPDAVQYPASTTKILTALLVIEAGDLDKLVTVEIADTKVEPSALEIKPGEQFSRRHLLYALLLKSANDVAMCLARDHSGSVEAFAERMTKRAAELGATNSNFRNPHGLHDPHHFTTAHDLALISLAAMKLPLFREIVATPEAWLLKGDKFVQLRNHNKLLWKFPGCTGLKTGFTNAARQTLVSSAKRDGREIISVVLRTNNPGIWTDSITLINYGFDRLGIAAPATEP